MVATTRSRTVRTATPVSPSGSKYLKPTSPHTTETRTTSKRSRPSPPQTPTRVRASQAKATRQKSRVARTKPKLPSEYELGPDGAAIIDQLTGYPVLSKYGQRVLNERRRCVADLRAPQADLDSRLRPRLQGIRQPTLHFGLGCNMSDILDCAQRRGYLTRPLDDPFRESNGKYRVWSHLRCRQIDCKFERILSNEYEFVVALYSNYDQSEKQLVEEDEEDCLRIIRTELGLGDRQPMWYWDAIKSGIHYDAPLGEYNVPNLHKITVPVEDDI